jgi:cell division protein FtsQ
MVKKILSIVAWVLTAAALIVLFVFAREDYLTSPVKDVKVNIEREGDSGFIKERFLLADIDGLRGHADIGTVNMSAIQKHLEAIPWIEHNSAYIDLEGTLCVSVKEYEPVLRIFGNDGRSVYLTENNVSIPTNRLYTPHVLVASGSFSLRNDTTSFALNDTLDEDKPLIEALQVYKAIKRNPFMQTCIGQIYRNNRGSFDIVVKDIDAQVTLGDTCQIDDKLRRAEIFIKQKAGSAEIKALKNINLKYKNQVVCTKR